MVVRSWKQLAALVEAIAPPVETNFTAEVRLEGVRGIGEDFPWVFAHVYKVPLRDVCDVESRG